MEVFQTTYFRDKNLISNCLYIYPILAADIDKDTLIIFYINIATQPFF